MDHGYKLKLSIDFNHFQNAANFNAGNAMSEWEIIKYMEIQCRTIRIKYENCYHFNICKRTFK